MSGIDAAASLEEIAALLQDVLQDDGLVVTPETRRGDLPQWDSMTHLNIVMALELRYRIKFALAEIDQPSGNRSDRERGRTAGRHPAQGEIERQERFLSESGARNLLSAWMPPQGS